jgi:predicted SprT family Zn-dependent metalloprotease
MFQLNLQFLNNKDTLRDYWEKVTGKTVSLIVTDNSTSLLSLRTKGKSVSLRLHWMFLRADNHVIREIAAFIKNGKTKTPFISEYIRKNDACLKNKPFKTPAIHTQGRYHNLRELFVSVNDEYFNSTITALITWGKKNPRWSVRKRMLGSFCRNTNTIRINPVLDRKTVPQYIINFVIYHEMLHSVMPVEKKNGRRLIHTAEFRRREQLFKDYKKAAAWEKRG